MNKNTVLLCFIVVFSCIKAERRPYVNPALVEAEMVANQQQQALAVEINLIRLGWNRLVNTLTQASDIVLESQDIAELRRAKTNVICCHESPATSQELTALLRAGITHQHIADMHNEAKFLFNIIEQCIARLEDH